MGYEQIDGVKDILVNEKGQLREELRTLPLDSDRIIYQYDENNNKKNAWPKVIISQDKDGNRDVRLLPELVLKEHGKLPRQVPCSPEDFESVNGKKLPPHCNIENIRYVGDGSFEAQRPYKQAPDKSEDKSEDKKAAAKQESPEGKKVKHKSGDTDKETNAAGLPGELADVADKDKSAAEDSGDDDNAGDDESVDESADKPPVSTDGGDEPSDLMKGSAELTAKKAIKIIRNFEYEELADVGFYTEDERDDGARVTVKDAWESKKSSARS